MGAINLKAPLIITCRAYTVHLSFSKTCVYGLILAPTPHPISTSGEILLLREGCGEKEGKKKNKAHSKFNAIPVLLLRSSKKGHTLLSL